MIHMLQVLCGPKRHAIYGIMYDDQVVSPQDTREGIEAMIEMWIDHGMLRRRCEICDAPISAFLYEDGITKEQNWDKAKEISERLGKEQMLTRKAVMAARKVQKN